MRALVAALPILWVLAAMLGLGWSAARAGLTAAAGAVVLALWQFDLGSLPGTDGRPIGAGIGIAGVLSEALFVTATVIAIIGPALGIHHLQQRTGATEALQSALGRLTSDPRIAALLIAWFFALFIEGAAGFGTPIALAAPFLVAAGFQPITAVAAALFGHAIGVSFGAVGTPVIAQAAISGIDAATLASATAPYHVALGWILAAAVVITIGRAVDDAGIPWSWGALAAVTMIVPYAMIARWVGAELPTLGGAVIGAIIFIAAVRMAERRRSGPRLAAADPGPATMSTVVAASPYLALIATVLITRVLPAIREPLESVELRWEIAGVFNGSITPLTHPAVLLTLSFVIGAIVQRATRERIGRAVLTATRQLVPVIVALIAMVTIARSMSQSGMTEELALAATATGGAWPLLSPIVGALGTFVTGSATASNILFTELQLETAIGGGFDTTTLLGAQGFGAAVGNIICPHNIVAAAATVGLTGAEGRILRRTFPVAMGYVVAGGTLAWWWTR